MTHRTSVLSLVLAACSSSSNPAAPDAPDAALPTTCNSVVEAGDFVEQTKVAAAMPAATGGTIADGRYVFTHWYIYTGVGGDTGGTGVFQSETAEVTGTTIRDAGKFAPSDLFSQNEYTFTTSGSAITITRTCPPPDQVQLYDHFSASASIVTFYAANQGFEYTLMP